MEMKWKLTVPLDKCNCSCFFIWLLSNICGHFWMWKCNKGINNKNITDLIMGLCRSLEINMLFRKGKEGSNGFYTCRCFLFLSLPNNTPNANSSKCLLLNQVQRPKIGEGLWSQYLVVTVHVLIITKRFHYKFKHYAKRFG